MATEPDIRSAFLALSRFGYGARRSGNDLATAATDPRAFLKAELESPAIAVVNASTLPSSREALQALFAQRQRIQIERQKTPTPSPQAIGEQDTAKAVAPDQMATRDSSGETKKAEQPVAQQLFRAETLVRFQKVAAADVGFVERLVQFWSNHFCVSATKGGVVRATAGSFEREAIRPHVLGRFADMLRAVIQHPAMLAYLDNAQSFGPTSRAGQNRKRGLNENLAREILELHTLGVGGPYGQSDVTALAQSHRLDVCRTQGRIGSPVSSPSSRQRTSPGPAPTRKTYRAGGIEQGELALADLARHPVTARHIATQLAQHFVATSPRRISLSASKEHSKALTAI